METIQHLFNAIESGNLDTTRELFEAENDIDVNTKDWDGRTPLHVACRSGRLQIAKYLIQEMHANVNAVNSCGGWTPLYLACVACQNDEHTVIEIAELLLANGANVNTKTQAGHTALHLACRTTRNGSNMQLIRVLLNHGADINAQDWVGATPLFDGYAHGADIDVIKLLLANNADRYIQNKSGKCLKHLLRGHILEEVFESYDLWPLAVCGIDKHTSRHGTACKKRTYAPGTAVVRLNPDLSQHQWTLGLKTLMLVRQLSVHEVAYGILGFLTPASVEKIFLPTV